MSDLYFRVGRADTIYFSAAFAENSATVANAPISASTDIKYFDFISLAPVGYNLLVCTGIFGSTPPSVDLPRAVLPERRAQFGFVDLVDA
jgi:hypothetical protein